MGSGRGWRSCFRRQRVRGDYKANPSSNPSAEGVEFFENESGPCSPSTARSATRPPEEGARRIPSRFAGRGAQGRRHGPAVVPGRPEKSLLVRAVRQTDENLDAGRNWPMPKSPTSSLG